MRSYVDAAIEDGATVVTGDYEFDENSNFVNPMLFVEADNSMRVSQEEIFGPALTCLLYTSDAADE